MHRVRVCLVLPSLFRPVVCVTRLVFAARGVLCVCPCRASDGFIWRFSVLSCSITGYMRSRRVGLLWGLWRLAVARSCVVVSVICVSVIHGA